MVRYLIGVYKGGKDKQFKHNQQYPIAVKTRWWKKQVSMYQRRGYYDEMQPGTLRNYVSKIEFNQYWSVTEEE